MQIAPLDANLKDWTQAASWLIAVIGGVVAVFNILYEMRENRSQRAEELRWKRAQAAKVLNDEMLDDGPTYAALVMLDWSGRQFEIQPSVRVKIATHEFLTALRTNDPNFSDTEIFVRDAFDSLFYHMGVFEHYISRTLIEFDDVKHPIDYYVVKMAEHKPTFSKYIFAYGFDRSSCFLERFDTWKSTQSVSSDGQAM